MRQNGYSLPWLEERKEIESEVQRFRAQLALGLRSANVMEVKDWAKSQIDRLNRRIFRYNLGVPLDRFQVTSLNLEQEVERAQPVSD